MSSAALALSKPVPYFYPSPPFVGEAGAYVDNEMRITSGHAQARIVKLIFAMTFSAARKPGTKAPKHSCPCHVDRCASTLAADHQPTDALRRLAQLVITEGCERKLLFRRQATRADFLESKTEVPQSLRGWFVYWLPTDWAKVPSYVAKKPVAMASELDSAEEPAEEAPSADLQKMKLRPAILGGARLKMLSGHPTKLPLEAEVSGKRVAVPIHTIRTNLGPGIQPLELDAIMHRGVIEIKLFRVSNDASAGLPRLGEDKANNRNTFRRKQTGLLQAKELSNGDISTVGAIPGGRARAALADAEVSGREVTERIHAKREALNGWFRRTLGPVDDEIARRCVLAQATATDDDVFAALRRRAKAIKGYGLVVEIHGDVGRAAAKAGPIQKDRHRPGESPEDIAARARDRLIENLAKALKWLAEDPKDRDALAMLESADPELLAEAKATS